MRKPLAIIAILAIIAVIASFGIALADRPPPGGNNHPPSNPPCDSDHGHPLANLTRHGRDCPPGHNGGGGGNGPPGNPPCDSDHHGVRMPPGLLKKCPPNQPPPPPPPPPPPSGGATTCSTDGLLSEGTLLNSDQDENGPASKPIHESLEPGLGAPLGKPVVHEVNCDAVVTVETLLGAR